MEQTTNQQSVILSYLLERYEASSHLLSPGKSNRRVSLQTDQTKRGGGFPEYDYENAAVRDAYNKAARELERRGIVELEWISERPVLSRIILNLNQVDAAYELVNRPHPRAVARSTADCVRGGLANVASQWIRDWGEAVARKAEERLLVPAYCKAGNLDYLSALLRVLQCFDGCGGEPITVRAFSIRCFQDSKRFEREYQKQFLEIARKYDKELSETCAEEELSERDQLAFLGLYAAPELYEMSGRCSLSTERGSVDLSPLYPLGFALPGSQAETVSAFRLDGIRRILFIENRTNYDAYLRQSIAPDEFVLYQGGFLSPSKRRLFQTLARSIGNSHISTGFWADIDMGGFRMFEQLRQIFPDLIPVRMSEREVERYHAHGLSRSAEYLKTLRDAMNENRFPLFSDAIRAILQYGVTIEQEVMIE